MPHTREIHPPVFTIRADTSGVCAPALLYTSVQSNTPELCARQEICDICRYREVRSINWERGFKLDEFGLPFLSSPEL